MRDMVKIATAAKGTIPDPYTLTCSEMTTLFQMARVDLWNALVIAFCYGYELSRREGKNRRKRQKKGEA